MQTDAQQNTSNTHWHHTKATSISRQQEPAMITNTTMQHQPHTINNLTKRWMICQPQWLQQQIQQWQQLNKN